MAVTSVSTYGEEADGAVRVDYMWHVVCMYCVLQIIVGFVLHRNFWTSLRSRLVIILALIPTRPTLRLLLGPIQPTALIVPQILIPSLTRQLTRRCAPFPGPAEEDDLLLGQGFGEGVFGLEGAGVVRR